jgi:hemerythrin-like domain-containing protein
VTAAETTAQQGPALSEVRQRRTRLRDAVRALEDELASPAQAERWPGDVTAALEEFLAALEQHIEGTEDGEGLFADVLEQSPRLASRIERLRQEHDEMRILAEDLLGHVRDGVRDESDVQRIRDGGLVLLRMAVRHRQRGSDLLYEAYEVDIAAGD